LQGTSNGTLDFNLISVFPPTYKGRKNGLRIDIAEALEELNPVSSDISQAYIALLTFGVDFHSIPWW
jgi:hypothetical protein